MSEEEEWVRTAMSDDSMVVEMLLRLHKAEPPPAPTRKKGAPVLQLEWSVRQRRSKQVPRKKGDATRASPTTPLSWSGATSVSGGAADGFEESSKLLKPIDNPRSKLVSVLVDFLQTKMPLGNTIITQMPQFCYICQILVSFGSISLFFVVATGETTTSKRSRKKKTLAELKEEENLLLKERRNLKNKLASLRITLEKQRAENESLKRMKLDVLSRQTTETVRASACQESILNQPHQMKAACDPSGTILLANGACNEVKPSPSNVYSEVQEGGSKGSSFLLPDLNLPFDGNSGSGNLYAVC